jgi:hypothetical protein
MRLRKWGLGEVPATLWAYAALSLGNSLVITGLEVSEHPWWLALISVGLGLSYLLLRRFRAIWWLLVIASAADLVTAAFSSLPWWRILLDVVYLALLVAGPSRHYVFATRKGRGSAGSTQNTSDPGTAPDSDRPAGWYVDAVNPRRMRYWNPELGEWQGRTKTPRRIRNEPNRGVATVGGSAEASGLPQETWDADRDADADRPRGWYIDTEFPERMRYWAGAESGWTGRARTPAKIRKAWEESRRPDS